ncbi:MAG: HEAT repeat domain-containing protein, partial [Planctomycetaceae bacterium]|nr:HEAT repeat domain-containing protein [Planctomycetaceae bacterium]
MSALVFRNLSGLLRLSVAVAAVSAAAVATAQTKSTEQPSGDDSSALKVTIDDISLNNMGGLNNISGMFLMEITVTNQTEEPIELNNAQFKFQCADVERPCSTAVRSPLLARPRTLKPGETASGAIGANLSKTSEEEPPMRLTWSDGQRTASAGVNEAFRKMLNLNTSRVGPDDCLAVVTIEKPVGIMASWSLGREFQRLKDDGLKRVVLHIKADPQNSMSYSHRMAVYGWLGSIKIGYEQRRFGFNQNVSSKVQFPDFQVVGMGTRDPYGYSTTSSKNIYRNTLDEAIASCLRSLYLKTDIGSALRDMNHEEAGVRRVALETNIDRLTESQLKTLLAPSTPLTPTQQAQLAANLHRVAYPIGVQTLRKYSASEHPEVVRAAIDGLVQSASPLAVNSLQEVWQDNDSDSIRTHIVNSVLTAQDFRHANLIEQHAYQMLQDAQGSEPKKRATTSPPASPPSGSSPPTKATAARPTSVSLRRVLNYLQNQDRSGIRDAARRAVPHILQADIQDSIVDFLVRNTTEQDEQLAAVVRGYVMQRLSIVDAPEEPELPGKSGRVLTEAEKLKLKQQFGLRSSRDPRISTSLFNVIRRFPDSQYTPSLLKLAESSLISNSLKRTAYQVATQSTPPPPPLPPLPPSPLHPPSTPLHPPSTPLHPPSIPPPSSLHPPSILPPSSLHPP